MQTANTFHSKFLTDKLSVDMDALANFYLLSIDVILLLVRVEHLKKLLNMSFDFAQVLLINGQ